MQKVDIAIATVGAVALIATVLGVVLYDDGLTDFHVQATDSAISGGPTAVPTGGLTVDLPVPDNSLGADLNVTVSFASQNPAATGNVNVLVTLMGPDNQTHQESCSAQFGAGSCTIAIAAMDWDTAPMDFRGTQDDADAKHTSWSSPLVLKVNVQYQGGLVDTLSPATFSAAYSGMFHGFDIQHELPEPETV